MKKIYQILCAALLVAGAATNISCTDYQDEIDALDYRVTVLENLVKKINNNIEAMQVTVTAMQNGDYITGVRETENGYLVNFYKAGPIYIIDGVVRTARTLRLQISLSSRTHPTASGTG